MDQIYKLMIFVKFLSAFLCRRSLLGILKHAENPDMGIQWFISEMHMQYAFKRKGNGKKWCDSRGRYLLRPLFQIYIQSGIWSLLIFWRSICRYAFMVWLYFLFHLIKLQNRFVNMIFFMSATTTKIAAPSVNRCKIKSYAAKTFWQHGSTWRARMDYILFTFHSHANTESAHY